MTAHQRPIEHDKPTVKRKWAMTPLSPLFFAEVRRLKSEHNEGALFACTTYNTYVHIVTPPRSVTQVKCLIDVETVTKLVRKSFLHLIWTLLITRQNILTLNSASEKRTITERAILLHLKISHLCVRVCFEVADILEADLLLITNFINKHIQGLFPTEREIVPWLSQLI